MFDHLNFNFDDLLIAASCGEEIAEERLEQLLSVAYSLVALLDELAPPESNWEELRDSVVATLGAIREENA